MELTVKKATVEDIPAIYEIIQKAFTKYQEELGTSIKVAALTETPDDIKSDLINKCVLIALLDNKVIGTIRYEVIDDNTVYISRFGVDPDYQRCGAGTALMKAVEQDIMDKNIASITLHTALKMHNLIRFYQHLGYYIESTAFNKGYIRALLRKPLNKKAESIEKDIAVAGQ